MADHPEFYQAVHDGRDLAVAIIEDAIFDRATGVAKSQQRVVIQHPDGSQTRKVIDTDLPADPGCAKMLLVNWAPEDYTDSNARVDVTSKGEKLEGGGPGIYIFPGMKMSKGDGEDDENDDEEAVKEKEIPSPGEG
jgi:hypothetical protein